MKVQISWWDSNNKGGRSLFTKGGKFANPLKGSTLDPNPSSSSGAKREEAVAHGNHRGVLAQKELKTQH